MKKLYRYEVVFTQPVEVNAPNKDEAIAFARHTVFGKFENMAGDFKIETEKLYEVEQCDICNEELDGIGDCGCTNKSDR